MPTSSSESTPAQRPRRFRRWIRHRWEHLRFVDLIVLAGACLIIVIGLAVWANKRPANQARRLDPNARCVHKDGNLAFCRIHNVPHWCDDDSCVSAESSSP